MSADTTFTTIRSVGGLLPTSLLGRVADLDRSLLGTTPSSFQLEGTTRVNEPIAPVWNRLKTRWGAFISTMNELPPGELGTTETREFLLALLGELGLAVTPGSMDVNGDRYPVSHTADAYPVPVHLLSSRVDIDRRTKGVDGAATRAPHGLVQELLNRSDDHLWALVAGGTGMEEDETDGGLVLRLLRDNQSMTRQAYVEFDLGAMFDGDVYADFVVLWLTLHHTRFAGDQPSDCLLERWLNAAEEAGARALDTLRDGVEDAITTLGTGLLSHRDNTELRRRLQDGDIDAEEMYRQLLRVVYRLLFLFVAEDRDLLLTPAEDAKPKARERYLDWYSTARLRAMAREVGGGRHPDLWRQLIRVLHELGSDTGCEELALPPLGGGLFATEATADVIGERGDTTSLANADLLDAIRDLAWTVEDGVVRSVDFRNLGSEELGSVYESLLELVPRASATAQEFMLQTVAGNQRRSTGSYYTPSSLIKILLDEALDPLLDDAETKEEPEDALLSLTVCDPASGSGHFLVAAANRIAERLAAVRSGDQEPSPVDLQQALRDVVAHCIYGVDVNPMAAELAKVTLWLECHVPGQPMTFLDHHIKVGNTLIGVGFDTSIADWNPEGKYVADRGGIPDDAFRKQTGDEKSACNKYKKRSRALRDQKRDLAAQGDLFSLAAERGPTLYELAEQIDEVDDQTVEGVHEKERKHREMLESYAYTAERLKFDAWCAAWTMTKTEERLAEEQTSPVEIYYRAAAGHDVALDGEGVDAVVGERERVGFFHWTVEFPNIAENGGFDLLIGNPPWERIKLQEKEWFANSGRQDVAEARNAAARKKAIKKIAESDDPIDQQVYAQWVQNSHDAEALSQFARKSERFPLGGVGDVNTYSVFADHFVTSVSPRGRVGILVPTGIITDYTYREFFASLVDDKRLAVAYDFENKGKRLFPDVHASFRFCTLVVTAPGQSPDARFAFMVHEPSELADPTRSYVLSSDDIALVNPNTKTAPVFLTPRDAEITTSVYRRHPVLIEHDDPNGNPWEVELTTMFHMANDADLFHVAEDLEAEGWKLSGNIYERSGERMLPLYEAKFFTHFDHREKDYSKTDDDKLFVARAYAYPFDGHEDPTAEVVPRYWVHEREVADQLDGYQAGTILAWSDITAATNHRTTIAALLPTTAFNDTCLLAMPAGGSSAAVVLQSVLCSFAFDWVARKKLSGVHMKFYLMEQLPVPAPSVVGRRTPWSPQTVLSDWLGARSAALSASSWVMAEALGYEKPIVWDEERRSIWRAEIDAAMFHLFGHSRGDAEYVLDDFPIVARNDREAEGRGAEDRDWKTKRMILERFDQFKTHIDEGTAYESPTPPPPLPEHLRLGRSVSQ